jgi:site-specific recombinase XerD
MPALFSAAGERASFRLLDFFAASIRNPNTRKAYARAIRRFSDWCVEKNLRLEQLNSLHVAAYIEELVGQRAAPTVKQHLAAIRMLFD